MLTEDFLIEKIYNLQTVKEDKFYSEGLFPSQRFHPILSYIKEDNNIFFTALIVFTLQQLKPNLSNQSQSLVEGITKKAIQNYPKYRSKRGENSYNYWQTRPPKPFPNSRWMSRFTYFQLPDDVDDTALVYLTKPHAQREVLALKNRLIKHANLVQRKIKGIDHKYENLPAYTTWFGKNMYYEFDVCVLCNLMYLIFENNLPLNQYDEASLTYIKTVIESDEHLTKPYEISHHYTRSALIIYHIARLISSYEIEILNPYKEKLIQDIYAIYPNTEKWMEKILLAIAALKLGAKPPDEINLPNYELIDFQNFHFFIIGLLTSFENTFIQKIAPYPFFHLYSKCEAYNLTLVLEYLVLKKNM